MAATYLKAFENLYVFKGQNSLNYAFVSTMQKKQMSSKEIVRRSKTILKEKKLDIDLPAMADMYDYASTMQEPSADILTDDFAPVDILKNRRSGKL